MLWQREKPREPQCLTVAPLCKLWHSRKVKHTGCPFGCLPIHSGRDPSASDFSATFSWCQQETACDGGVSLQKEVIYRWVLRNGVYFQRVSSRNQDKSFHQARRKWGSLQTSLSQAFRETLQTSLSGCSPHFPHAFDVVRRRFSPQGVASEQTALP